MTDEEFAKLVDEVPPVCFNTVDWQGLTPPQQTFAAVFVLFPMAEGDYEGLAGAIAVLQADAYIKAFEDLGFPETAAILRRLASVDRAAVLDSDELFELAVDLEYNEREIWALLEAYAKKHMLFPRSRTD